MGPTAEQDPFKDGLDQALTCTGGLQTDIALGMGSPDGIFANMSTKFSLGTLLIATLSEVSSLPSTPLTCLSPILSLASLL